MYKGYEVDENSGASTAVCCLFVASQTQLLTIISQAPGKAEIVAPAAKRLKTAPATAPTAAASAASAARAPSPAAPRRKVSASRASPDEVAIVERPRRTPSRGGAAPAASSAAPAASPPTSSERPRRTPSRGGAPAAAPAPAATPAASDRHRRSPSGRGGGGDSAATSPDVPARSPSTRTRTASAALREALENVVDERPRGRGRGEAVAAAVHDDATDTVSELMFRLVRLCSVVHSRLAQGEKDIADGEVVRVSRVANAWSQVLARQIDGGHATYVLKNVGGVYSCSCVSWRYQSAGIDRRTVRARFCACSQRT